MEPPRKNIDGAFPTPSRRRTMHGGAFVKSSAHRLVPMPLVGLLALVSLTPPAYADWGVQYSFQAAIGMQGGSSLSFCTQFLQSTSGYDRPFELFEAVDTFERGGSISTEGSVAMGQAQFQTFGTINNLLAAAQYGGGVQASNCSGTPGGRSISGRLVDMFAASCTRRSISRISSVY